MKIKRTYNAADISGNKDSTRKTVIKAVGKKIQAKAAMIS